MANVLIPFTVKFSCGESLNISVRLSLMFGFMIHCSLFLEFLMRHLSIWYFFG